MTFAQAGILYIADTGNHAVRKIDNGVVSTVAGTGHDGFLDGPAMIAEFKQPSGVAVDQSGNVVVADTMNNTLRMITTSSPNPAVTTIAGTRKEGFVDGDPGSAQFKQPNDVLVEGAAFIADTKNDAIRVIYSALSATAAYPRTADPNGGTAVRLFGAGFVPGAMRVAFGGVAASSVTYVTSTELLVTAPPHPIGSVDIVVSSPNGAATLQNTFQYLPPFIAVRVTPASPTITSGQRQQFTAIAVAADNSTIDVTSRATWSSSDPTVATIDANGLASSLKAGTTSVSATFANLTQTILLTVVAPETPPPDPSTLATLIDGTVVTSISDTVQFLYTGANPIQRGVSSGTIQPARVAVLRGQIRSSDGTPLPGVRVTILGHPELGHTLSRADGGYDFAVNGGGDVTFDYKKSGYISAQRRTRTPWRDFVVMDDVLMTPFDTAATTITMAAATMQVARGNAVSDSDGTRRATMLIPAGTTATIETASGVQVAPTLTIRATEFTVGSNGPKMMPAALPPPSAYTYCVELSADEAVATNATALRFSQPLPFYVENFLGLPVGTPVPVGFYDRTRSAWIAQANGIVLKILGVSAGRATVDLNGDGVADDPSSIGMSADELQQLASLYQPGQTLWRMTTNHFSALDCNLGFRIQTDLPTDALTPANSPPVYFPGVESPTTNCRSIIDCHNQVFGESIPIVGTPFALEYKSDQVPGHLAGRTVDIPISGATVPASLRRIDVDIRIMGRSFHYERPPLTGQSIRFTWDGLDAYGRAPQGAQVAHIQIGYVYRLFVYSITPADVLAFALYGTQPIPLAPTRQEQSLIQTSVVLLGDLGSTPFGFGGWRIDAHEVFNANGGVLSRGPGQNVSASLQQPTITTFAGGGLSNAPSGFATDMNLASPFAVTTAPDGSVYFSEGTFGGTIRRVVRGGILSTVASTSLTINAMVYGPDDSLYVANGGLLRVDPVTGAITNLNAPFACCNALAFGPEGNLYLAPTQTGIVRRNSDGTFSPLTGDASLPQNVSPVGVPARTTNIGPVNGMTVGRDGSVYFSVRPSFVKGTNFTGRVLRIPPTGIIERFAGTDTSNTGFSGDGGPAVQAELSFPDALAVAPDGSLYISDTNTFTIRRVLPNGVIETVAGNPAFLDYSPDGTPAAASYVFFPKKMAVRADGAVYVEDDFLMKVRKIAPPDTSETSGQLLVPSSDGRTASLFGPSGRHLKTVDAVTNATLYAFQYDSAGRLSSIADSYGNITTIERDAAGNATAITSPFGSRTVLAIQNGYLASVTNPAGEHFQMTHSPDGLLTGFTNPRNIPKTITYDGLGRFIREDTADGGSLIITGPPTIGGSFQVAVHSAEGQTTTHDIQRDAIGNDVRTDTDVASRLKTTTLRAADGSQSIALPDGSRIQQTVQGDPRFLSLAPLRTTTTPGGHHMNLQSSRSVVLANRFDPLSVTSLTESLSLNGRQWQTTFTSANRTLFGHTPAGRQSTSVLNANDDTIILQAAGLAAVNFSYNTLGQLTSIQQSTRQTQFAYNSSGFVDHITDPLNRTIGFLYDKAGRVTQQTLPDGRLITFAYDANGNVTSVTPPSRPAHGFTWTVRDDQQQYTPPAVPAGGATQYTYNRDRQLTSVLRPDGQSIGLSYDASARLSAMTTTDGCFRLRVQCAGRSAQQRHGSRRVGRAISVRRTSHHKRPVGRSSQGKRRLRL
jgi:YD repeat-containing protein